MRLSSLSPMGLLFMAVSVGGCDADAADAETSLDGGDAPSAEVVGDARVGEFDAAVDASAPSMETLTVRFRAKVGDAEFVCGARYPGQGVGHSTITPRDFRFYVEQVVLESAQGETFDPGLTVEDGNFQKPGVALIDFTDETGACSGGPDQRHETIELVVPAGKTFVGLRFTLGVEEALNHGDPTQAPAPLQAPGASWDWVAGYRFLIAEVLPGDATLEGGAHGEHEGLLAGDIDAGAHGGGHGGDAHGGHVEGGVDGHEGTHGGDAGAHGGDAALHGGHGEGPAGLGLIHLGSTGCTREGDAFQCDRPNRVQVTLRDFDPRTNVVIADLGALFRDADLRGNMQCHSGGDACVPMFEALGVDFATGQPLPTQRVFRVE